jgi:hypothetical protein
MKGQIKSQQAKRLLMLTTVIDKQILWKEKQLNYS